MRLMARFLNKNWQKKNKKKVAVSKKSETLIKTVKIKKPSFLENFFFFVYKWLCFFVKLYNILLVLQMILFFFCFENLKEKNTTDK